jgi:hypothetical protein
VHILHRHEVQLANVCPSAWCERSAHTIIGEADEALDGTGVARHAVDALLRQVHLDKRNTLQVSIGRENK